MRVRRPHALVGFRSLRFGATATPCGISRKPELPNGSDAKTGRPTRPISSDTATTRIKCKSNFCRSKLNAGSPARRRESGSAEICPKSMAFGRGAGSLSAKAGQTYRQEPKRLAGISVPPNGGISRSAGAVGRTSPATNRRFRSNSSVRLRTLLLRSLNSPNSHIGAMAV